MLEQYTLSKTSTERELQQNFYVRVAAANLRMMGKNPFSSKWERIKYSKLCIKMIEEDNEYLNLILDVLGKGKKGMKEKILQYNSKVLDSLGVKAVMEVGNEQGEAGKMRKLQEASVV